MRLTRLLRTHRRRCHRLLRSSAIRSACASRASSRWSTAARKPIRSAPRLLLTHLTDLQNSGASYAEEARKTLLGWGGLPHLVRDGAAQVRISVDAPEACAVWALSTGGRRLERVATTVVDGRLVIPVRVRAAEGARMLYEITRER